MLIPVGNKYRVHPQGNAPPLEFFNRQKPRKLRFEPAAQESTIKAALRGSDIWVLTRLASYRHTAQIAFAGTDTTQWIAIDEDGNQKQREDRDTTQRGEQRQTSNNHRIILLRHISHQHHLKKKVSTAYHQVDHDTRERVICGPPIILPIAKKNYDDHDEEHAP